MSDEQGESRRGMRWGRWSAAVLALVCAGAGGAIVASAAIPDSSGVIHSCYQKNTTDAGGGSALLVVDSAKGKCPSGYTSLTFNQTGPQGIPGPSGPPGASGSPGASGAPGSPGANGLSVGYGASAEPDVTIHSNTGDVTFNQVYSTPLPNGHYIVNLTLGGVVQSPTPHGVLACEIAGGLINGGLYYQDITDPYVHYMLNDEVTVTTGSFAINCYWADTGSADFALTDVKYTAVAVDSFGTP